MPIEDMLLIRFDFIERSEVSEFENVLQNHADDEVNLSVSSSSSDNEYVELGQWKSSGEFSEKSYNKIDFVVCIYREHLIVQTRLILSEHVLRQCLSTSGRSKSQKQASDFFTEDSQIIFDINQICSKYPSIVNDIDESPPIILHSTVNEPPGADSVDEWLEQHTSSLQVIGFTQTSGLQTIVNGTYVVSLESFPNYSSRLIAINIYANTQDELTLSSDIERLLRITSRYHLAYFLLSTYEEVIESRPEPTTTSKVIGAELDNLIKMEVAVIDKLGWYSDIRSNIQPRSSFLNLEPIPEQEDTVFRDNKAKLAEQTYFDYYQKELDEYHQEIVTSIENSHSQNKRLLSLIRDRINAIGTDKNVRLQKSIYILTFFMAVVSAISLVTTIINIS